MYARPPPRELPFSTFFKLCLVWKVFKIAANLEVSRRKCCKYPQIWKSCAESVVNTNKSGSRSAEGTVNNNKCESLAKKVLYVNELQSGSQVHKVL